MAEPKRLGLAKSILGRITELFPEVWPVTVWELDHTLKAMKAFKRKIADDGSAREHSGTAGYKTTLGSSPNQVSIFNPQIISNILQLYAPPPGSTIYDPFGGGGTRAITIASEGYKYIGIELRAEEVAAVNDRIIATESGENITLIEGNAMDPYQVPSECADMALSCPPYYDMEKYDGGYNDLSMAPDYPTFLSMLRDVIDQTTRILKPGALSFWIIGLHRDKYGDLLPMHHDLARIHRDLGYHMKEEIVLYMKNTGSIQRVGNFIKGNRLLVRQHEYCLIFEQPVPF
ncbi:hypothetical protein LCGC14_2619550 [marine sediment metagenome]|uniref:DNA methylase N-4/N-6 domain-containing protein n=1 Tax=marine sediment metagenome TaxID=412755 RepID=A0A0F9A3Q1_9ZZZZ